MATFVSTSAMTLMGTAWASGTAPGPGNPTISGTLTTVLDCSDHIKEVSIDPSVADVDFTNFGSGGFIEKKPGLTDVDVTVTFFNDFAASSVDVTLYPLFVAKTLTYWDFKPTNSARAATNPSLVFALYIAQYPINFGVGASAEVQMGFMIAGKHARLTA